MTTIRGASITYDIDGGIYIAEAIQNRDDDSFGYSVDTDETFLPLEDDVFDQLIAPLRDLVGDYE